MCERMNASIWLVVFAFFALLVTGPIAAGKIIYVDHDASGANDGSSWENAFTFLQDALGDAEIGDKPVEIRVGQGIYKPDQGAGITLGSKGSIFRLINGVALVGGYAGLTEPYPDLRNLEKYETILSGDLAGNDIDVNNPSDLSSEPTRSDNCGPVVSGSSTDQTAVLDGFTITGGCHRFIPIDSITGGAGMINRSGSPTLSNCTFTGNSAAHCGGGLLNLYDSNPIVTNCTFSSNYGGSGGGVYNLSSNPTLVDSEFTRNYAKYNGAGMGNGTSWDSPQACSPKLIDCIFDNNYALRYGGGVSSYESETILTDCTFLHNSAHQGGGMYSYSGNPKLSNCQFISNSASQGGGMYTSSGSPKLSSCQFIGNIAYGTGGGLANSDAASPTLMNCILNSNSANGYGGGTAGWNSIRNCIISGNIAVKDGGAIYGWGEVINCTIIGNKADRNGGGICTQGSTAVNNCILWGNVGLNGDEIYEGVRIIIPGRSGTILRIPSIMTVSYSNVQGGFGEVYSETDCTVNWDPGNIDADPCFVDPGYWADANDASVIVEPNDPNAVWIDGDYHLKSQAGRWDANSQSWLQDDLTSPCIDAGDPNSPIGHEPFPNGGVINMGAYGGTVEASKSYFGKPVCETIVAGDINGDCKVDFKDFAIMAYHWLEDNSP